MTEIQIREESITTLSEYAKVPIAFEYDRIFEVSTSEPSGFILTERHLAASQTKDYDAVYGEGPQTWSNRFDVSNWGFIVARSDGRCIGGAVIAFDTTGVDMLEGRRDLSVLWDLRVDIPHRGCGVGTSLFEAAERWASKRGCRQLKVETQNINLAACRFYARHGCTLRAINRLAYPDLPDEVQMLWYKDLVPVEE